MRLTGCVGGVPTSAVATSLGLVGAGEGATVAVVDLDRGQEASKQPRRAVEV